MSRRYTRVTADVAIDTTLATQGVPFQLEEIRLHLSAAGGAGDLTVTQVSGVNAVYNTVLLTQDMAAITDLHWQPDRPINYAAGDSLRVQWANGAGRVYGLEIVWSGM